MSNNIKQLRGQVRQIVKELLPEVLSVELMAAIEAKLIQQIKDGLAKIDERQRELQSYMVRNVNVPVAPKDKS